VKQESRDIEGVQGMLDHWEPLDSNIDGNRVVEVVAKAAAGLINEPSSMSKVKVEELECWDWEDTYGSSSPDWYHQSEEAGDSPHIKQEDIEFDDILVSGDDTVVTPSGQDALNSQLSPLPTAPSQSSLVMNFNAPGMSGLRRHSELTWKDVELLGPDSVNPRDFEDGEWQQGSTSTTIRARARTQPSLPTFEACRNISSFLPIQQPESPARNTPEPDDIATQPTASPTSLSPSTFSTRMQNSDLLSEASGALPSVPNAPPMNAEKHDVVVVYTCQPCTPTISATQIEGEFQALHNMLAALLKLPS
jgi:hypothetical protein